MKKILWLLLLVTPLWAQVTNPGANLPTPGSTGLCFVSTGSTQGSWTWGSCSGSTSANFSALVADAANTSGGAFQIGNSTSLGVTGTGAINATSALKWATARNLAGNSVDGSANVAFANKFIVQGTTDAGLSGAQFLGALGTGILKNTTSTGVLSIAVAADFPILNQNTTGSAASFTGSLVGDVTGTQGATVVGGLHFGVTGISLSSTAPTSGQCLSYNGTNIIGTTCGSGGAVSSVFGQTGAVPNLSQDATTSGSSVVSVVGWAGGLNLFPTGAISANNGIVGNAAGTTTYFTYPDCHSTNNALQWTQSSFAMSCVTISALTNPMTTLGDLITGGASGVPTRLAGPTGVNGVPQTLTSTPSGGAATAESWAPAGVVPRLSTCGSNADTILATDRAGWVQETDNTAQCVVTLPQAGTTGFASNFVYSTSCAGTFDCKIVPTTSTINGNANLDLIPGSSAFIYSDNTNYYSLSVATAFGGTNTQTTSYTATILDKDKLVVMNCSSTCTVTLPSAPPTSKWTIWLMSIGSSTPTISLNGLNFNGTSSVPALIRYMPIQIRTDGSNYLGQAPLVAGSNVTFTPASNGITIASSGGGGGAAGASIFNTTSSATATATSATSVLGGGAQTVPASTLIATSPLDLRFGGYYSTPVAFAGTLTINLIVDSTTVATTGAISTLGSVTNGAWRLGCQITVRTTGVSGTAIYDCPFEMINSSLTSLTPAEGSMANTSTFTIDTTSSHTIDLQATWSTTTGSPTITGTYATALIGGAPVTSVNGNTGAITGLVTTTGSPANAQMTGFSGSTTITTASAHTMVAPTKCIAGSGSGTAYTCTTSPSFTPNANDAVEFVADVANTASATLAVNGATAATIKKQGGGTNLVANDLLASQRVVMIYDGTNWQMQGQLGNASSGGVSGPGSSTNNDIASWNGTGGNTLADSGVPASNVYVAGGSGSADGIWANGWPSGTGIGGGTLSSIVGGTMYANLVTYTRPFTINHAVVNFVTAGTAETLVVCLYNSGGTALLWSGNVSTASNAQSFTGSPSTYAVVPGQYLYGYYQFGTTPANMVALGSIITGQAIANKVSVRHGSASTGNASTTCPSTVTLPLTAINSGTAFNDAAIFFDPN